MEFSVITIITLTISALLLIASVKVLAGKGWILGFLRGFGGLLMVLLAVVVGLGGLNLGLYGACSSTQSIANVSFEKVSLQSYEASVVEIKSGRATDLMLDGDMWNAGVQRLRFPLFGGKEFCRLSSLNTRYYSVEQQAARPTSDIVFGASTLGFDLYSLASSVFVPGIVADREETAFQPMEQGILFSVKRGESDFVISSLNTNHD
ncbi:Uncharacterised protein [BD1-7 clade bacterium]|uniref:Uncharacterized protein n=1 Tax=BD1-7 clade bacterium TaxID=2029982 RepID=A0A5S9QJ63_9GAMM|nr:Uncharacterised protein [BD1-7 clade bacterium]